VTTGWQGITGKYLALDRTAPPKEHLPLPSQGVFNGPITAVRRFQSQILKMSNGAQPEVDDLQRFIRTVVPVGREMAGMKRLRQVGDLGRTDLAVLDRHREFISLLDIAYVRRAPEFTMRLRNTGLDQHG